MEKPIPSPLKALTTAQLVDRLGEADRQFKFWTPQVNPHASRLAELLAELKTRHPDLAADQQDILAGAAYQVVVTPREIRRPITVKTRKYAWQALKKLGREPFEFFEITLAAMAAQLGKGFIAKHVVEERTGPRDYKISALAPAVALKQAA